MRNAYTSVRSHKRHYRPARKAEPPTYAHVPTLATWSQRRERNIPLGQQVCECCLVRWPCLAWLHDLSAADAELRAFWRDNGYAHASNVADAIGRAA